MRLRRRTNWPAGALAGVAALLLGGFVLAVTPAMAGVGGSDTPTWPGLAAVGDIINTSVLIINTSTAPNNTESIQLTTLFVTPSCADSASPICLGLNVDPGIFKVLPGTVFGDVSTPACAPGGTPIEFTVGTPDITTGEVPLTPQSPVILDPTSGGTNISCQVNLQLRVFQVPTNPAPGPPVTTNALTRLTLVGVDSGLNGSGSGSAQIQVVRGEVTLATASNPNSNDVVPGTSVTDSVTVTKAPGAIPPTGNVRFILCQPNEVNGSGCPGGQGSVVPVDKPLVGNVATSDPTNNTTAVGQYCWRVRFLGDANYNAQNHTNATTECFTTVQAPATILTASNPTGGGVAPGTSVSDTATVSGGVSQPTPTGTVTFFLCQPAQVTGTGCPSPAGAQVGAVKTLVGGQATSDSTTDTATPGTYCWRVEYSGDSAYDPASHTDTSAECFTVAVALVEVCKSPGYYGNHPVVTHAGIDALLNKIGGPLNICGQNIDNVDVPDPASGIEAICVKPSTDQTLPLHGGRNLMVAALNCVANDPTPGPGGTVCEGSSLDELFEACNAECAAVAAVNGGKQFSVIINNVEISCNAALDCYNNGQGFDPATGQCNSTVTCIHEQSTVGVCSGSGDLCSNNVPCPQGEECKGGSASPDSCKEARGNSCTIFSGSC